MAYKHNIYCYFQISSTVRAKIMAFKHNIYCYYHISSTDKYVESELVFILDYVVFKVPWKEGD